MFKNVMIFNMSAACTLDAAQTEAALQEARFVACDAHQEQSVGWVEPRGQAHGPLLELVQGNWLLKLMIETKVLPGAVVRRKAEEQAVEIQATSGRTPGRREQKELRESARQSLLPRAFTKQSSVLVWLDLQTQRVILDAASQASADKALSFLVKSLPGFTALALDTQQSAAACMAQWLSEGDAPLGFAVDRECELKATDEGGALVRYTRHTLLTEEVSRHIAQGKMPTRLALTWSDQVSFVLTQTLQLKKLSLLEGMDAALADAGDRSSRDDAFDGDVAIITGALRPLISALIDALGGVRSGLAAATAGVLGALT